jgi:hypothetical protein
MDPDLTKDVRAAAFPRGDGADLLLRPCGLGGDSVAAHLKPSGPMID